MWLYTSASALFGQHTLGIAEPVIVEAEDAVALRDERFAHAPIQALGSDAHLDPGRQHEDADIRRSDTRPLEHAHELQSTTIPEGLCRPDRLQFLVVLTHVLSLIVRSPLTLTTIFHAR